MGIFTKKTAIPFLAIHLLITVSLCNGYWEGEIVFEDNFDGNSLDLNKWEYQEGCDNRYGGNNLQCYTRNNIQVRDGWLKITARPEIMEDKEYTSGRIRQRISEFKYGAYVTRAKLARGDHLWPAIWLFPVNQDCRYEEIDIAEYRGQASEARNLAMAAHWGRSWDALTSQEHLAQVPSDLSADFHEFAVLWVPDYISWYVDNTKYFQVSLTNGTFNSNPNKLPCRGGSQPFDHPTSFIFNLAVGGPFFNDFPNFDPNTWSKPTMEVDWVRIYQG